MQKLSRETDCERVLKKFKKPLDKLLTICYNSKRT